MIAHVTVSPEEFAQRAYKPETLQQALAHVNEVGYLGIVNSFDSSFIKELRQSFLAEYDGLSEEQLAANCLQVGEKRFMVSMDIKKPFSNPHLYANPLVTSLLERLLGPGFVINSLTVVTALPGSQDQHLHLDHPMIFPELSGRIDPYAVTVAVPLVDLNEQTGATAMLPGSHKLSKAEFDARDNHPTHLPLPSVGSCYLMDYRLHHYGTANKTDRQRPIIYMVYSRPWFIDAANFKKQPPIKLRPGNLSEIPVQHMGLFKRVLDNTSHTMSMML